MSRFSQCKIVCLAVVACLVLSGCMVGPNYKKPADEVPPAWVEVPSGVTTNEANDLAQWWTLFKDPMLDSLIEQAMQANKDLKIAQARIREARAQRAVTASNLYPKLDSSASYSRRRSSQHADPSTLSGGAVENNDIFAGALDLYQPGFDASFELDIFGRVRRSVEAATADLAASRENFNDTLITLLSEVAINYITVRGSQLRLDITSKNMEAMRQTLSLTRERFNAGLSSELDVAQAQTQLASTESTVPTLETTARQSMHQLATLLGMPPAKMVEQLSVVAPVPGTPPEVPVGLPSELLRRRPDVRRAERELAAATARIGIATADLFPRFSLNGALGQSAMSLSDIALGSSTFWSFGPAISWNIFDGGATRANIEIQNARTEQALGAYEKAVLTSFQEVESALIAYSREQERRKSLREAVESSSRAYGISRELYASGLVDFLRVLESQRSLFVSQEALASSDQKVSTDLVTLYKALGGGWVVPAKVASE